MSHMSLEGEVFIIITLFGNCKFNTTSRYIIKHQSKQVYGLFNDN